MSAYAVAIDPPAAISGRFELDLNSGALQTDHAGVDWGEAAIKAFLAEQQYGESAVSFRVPNRVVTLPLMLGANPLGETAEEEEARRKLNEKVALLQRQGGVLLRQRPGAEPLYADIMTAAVTIPDVYGETGGVEPGTVLKLECLPDFYGDEITLDAIGGEGQAIGVLKQAGVNAVIKGDYPARTRIALTEGSEHDQRGALWGLRSRFYDASASAALFYDAVQMTPINGAVEVGESSAYSGKAIEIKPQAGIWHPFLSTDLVSGAEQLTHIGSYRVWVRARGAAGIRLRLAWSTDDAVTPTSGAAVTTDAEGWELLDLGEIRIPRPPIGEHWWRGIFQVNSAEGAILLADRVWLQPVDDGAGRLRATAVPSSTLLSPSKSPTEGANEGAGTAWGFPEAPLTAHSATVETNATSQVLRLRKPEFVIPEGVTIRGIEVVIPNVGVLFTEGVPKPGTLTAHLYKGGVLAGEAKNVARGSAIHLGGASDLWGTTWTPAQINSATFGVGIVQVATAAVAGATIGGPVVITVYYSYSAGALPEDAVLYSERASEIRFDGVFREDTTSGAYVAVSQVTGDLPRLPPSGLEKRLVQLLVKPSRGDLTSAEADKGIDKITAQVLYRPCYIGRI